MKSNCISRGPSPARSIRSSLRTMIFPALIAALPAAEVTVTTALDEDDGVLGGGKGISLREAILYAPDNSVIVFDLGLTCQTLTLAAGPLAIGRNLTIDASSPDGVVVSGNHASRVFSVAAAKTVTITGLDVVDGSNSGDGGAILNDGNLTLADCELAGNEAGDGGGAIENSGTLTLNACTFTNNIADVGGGAIEHAAGLLVATSCTFSGNTAGIGGAIDGDGSSTIQLKSCTVSANHATDDGGGLEETSGTLLLENTIVAGNTAADQGPDLKASGINTQAGVNLVSSTSGLGGSFSGIVADPKLSPLGNFGGITRTMPPKPGSPAIDQGGTTAFATDQRGLPRVVGAKVDIGAVEVQAGDSWELLEPTPFPHGVSAGGGLATDGRFVYAADLGGDGDNDFIDLNDNGAFNAGESLADQGIANGSVRFARFDPVAGTWLGLPAIGSAGGDIFSRDNFNGSLFCADGRLYYYQLRSGSATCVLHRYDLSAAPSGSWEIAWTKSYGDALLEPNAGMTATAAPGGAVLLHHRGAGSRDFCRTSALAGGGQHVMLTPAWPNDAANFPRNGAWEFDPVTGRVYHLSGDQLLAWSPSLAYPGASLLTSVPVAGSDLAVYKNPVPIASLKTTLGWNPGGSAAHPGASLWGNSITIVNEPSGLRNGPAGEDSGANAVYLVRGETTPDEWPFNEGRGQVNNGDFARWFPATGHAQSLAAAPFHVGKGSDSVYLGGYLYLTQGETRNSPDGAGNDAPLNANGIRRPGNGFARFRIGKSHVAANDDDLSVAWIQRLPILDYVWDSPDPHTDGWPAAGSTVTWRAMVKNWSPTPRTNVAYRWLLDGNMVASGTVDLLAGGYTPVDYPRTWTFERKQLAFVLDPENALAEFSESNNRVDTWTDAITVGFWVEHSFYLYMHRYQKDLGIGSNGFEDWAQRQVKLWNDRYQADWHAVDAPDGVLDRVRLDKITIVADDMLPLTEDNDLRTNKPDKRDRTVDLVWGFPSWRTPGKFGEGYACEPAFQDHSSTASSGKPFYLDWVLFHETSHARYLADVYSFNVQATTDINSGGLTGSQIAITVAGLPVEGTRYLPRVTSDHVFLVDGQKSTGPFYGLMMGGYEKIDRYSVMALNRIAGHRATRGNYNSPGNIEIFLDDLPAANTVQVSDGHGNLLGGATVKLYRGEPGTSGGSYPKIYDDVPDATFTADADGRIEVGRNPFTAGTPVAGGGVETIILRVEAGGKTGFGFVPVGLFNMEYWRGHTDHGRHELSVAMIGPAPDLARVLAWDLGSFWRFRIITSGTPDAASVTVDGHAATLANGAWEVSFPEPTGGSSQVIATWPGGVTLTETAEPDPPPFVPRLTPQKIPGGLRVGWWSRAGYRYELEHSGNLLDWLPADSVIHFGTGTWMEADDLVPAAAGRAFTRLQVNRLTD